MIDPYCVFHKGELIDPYRVARLFGITDPALAQALKKLLRSGRKHKTVTEDINEVITSCQRFLAMNAEDERNKGQGPPWEAPPAPPTLPHWASQCTSCSVVFTTKEGVDGVCPDCYKKTEGHTIAEAPANFPPKVPPLPPVPTLPHSLKCLDCGKPSLPGHSYCGTCVTEPGPR